MLQRLLGLTLLLLLLLLLLLFAAAVTTTGTGVSAAIPRASSSHGLPTVITTAPDPQTSSSFGKRGPKENRVKVTPPEANTDRVPSTAYQEEVPNI